MALADSQPLVVVAAVVERDGHFLVTQRLAGTHLAGAWEFPGGKCEPDESHEACLLRELIEELGVTGTVGRELLTVEHQYPDRRVRLHFRHCTLAGEPRPRLGQQMRWVPKQDLPTLPFPEADRDLIDLLAGTGGASTGNNG